jgi:DNA-directed RNA polymerase subunit M
MKIRKKKPEKKEKYEKKEGGMQFCPKCGLLLIQKRTRFVCPKCGYSAKGKVKITSSEKIADKLKVGLVKENDTNVWPVTSTTCPKCGGSRAYFWSAQLRAGDEAETQFYKCTKCKHVWREYR